MRLLFIMMLSFNVSRSPLVVLSYRSNEPDRTEFNDNNVKYWIRYYGIRFPEIVYRQYVIESARGKSAICKENNNLFGMRMPRKRPTTAVGENRNHAVYETYIKSIEDYKMYQEYNRDRIWLDYYLFLDRYSYSANVRYVEMLRRIKI